MLCYCFLIKWNVNTHDSKCHRLVAAWMRSVRWSHWEEADPVL